ALGRFAPVLARREGGEPPSRLRLHVPPGAWWRVARPHQGLSGGAEWQEGERALDYLTMAWHDRGGARLLERRNGPEAIMTRLVCTRPRSVGLSVSALLAFASLASALPVELKDQNGTRYSINTHVDPLLRDSNASGAIADATYTKAVTVTSYFVGVTPFGFFLTTYTVQRQINVPLTNAFAGFNGLLITGAQGARLPSPLV